MKGKWWATRPDVSTQLIKDLRAQGLSCYKIADRTGLSPQGVWQRLRKAAEPEKQKETWQEITKRRLVHAAKRRAKSEGVPFSLSYDDITVPDICPALGIPILLGTGRLTDNSPTLDKVIPALGYVKENVWVISWRANRAKSDLTIQELVRLATAAENKAKENANGS